jgi:hypothetical protein
MLRVRSPTTVVSICGDVARWAETFSDQAHCTVTSLATADIGSDDILYMDGLTAVNKVMTIHALLDQM